MTTQYLHGGLGLGSNLHLSPLPQTFKPDPVSPGAVSLMAEPQDWAWAR